MRKRNKLTSGFFFLATVDLVTAPAPKAGTEETEGNSSSSERITIGEFLVPAAFELPATGIVALPLLAEFEDPAPVEGNYIRYSRSKRNERCVPFDPLVVSVSTFDFLRPGIILPLVSNYRRKKERYRQ